MSGTVNISRGIFSSEAFRKEPLTEREAWVWLVMAASWKCRSVRSGDYVAETERGQLAHSIRYMAKAWDWTPAKVQRYLKRIEKLKMIRVKTDTGVSVITICKYNEYQNKPQTADTGPIQDRYRTDTEKNKEEIPEGISEERESDLFSAESKTEIKEGFIEFWDNIWPRHERKAGKADCLKVYEQACKGKHPKSDKIAPADLNAAAKRFIVSVTDKQYLPGPLPWLRKPGWEPFINGADGPPVGKPMTYAQRILAGTAR